MAEDNASNDAATTETADKVDDLSDKPLMQLFKRLIGNENKQNTVMTNAQILDILEKEFNIDTPELHELETEIYLSIMKQFLKDWPQWDEFDRAINMVPDRDKMQDILISQYHDLKGYLSIMLDIASPRAKDKVKEVEEQFTQEVQEDNKEKEEDTSDVILEIYCSRQQLNTLFYRHPHPEQNYTIFNANQSEPSKITLKVPDYNAILNWWDVGINFKYNNLNIKRVTSHNVTHTLLNQKLHKKDKYTKLKKGCYFKSTTVTKNSDNIGRTKSDLIKLLARLYDITFQPEHKAIFEVLYPVFEKDLESLPYVLQENTIYKKYFSKYPYVRYLSTEVPEAKDDAEAMKYDLQLREQLKPMYQFQVIKMEPVLSMNDLTGINLECKSCSMKFSGITMLEQLRQHILESHFNEPDWQCVKCKQTFCMVELANNRWCHDCTT